MPKYDWAAAGGWGGGGHGSSKRLLEAAQCVGWESAGCCWGALRWRPGIIAVDIQQVIVQLKHVSLQCGSTA